MRIVLQVTEQEKEAVRATYLSKHPNAFWVVCLFLFFWISSWQSNTFRGWIHCELLLQCINYEGWLWWLSIHADWTKSCAVRLRGCDCSVRFRRLDVARFWQKKNFRGCFITRTLCLKCHKSSICPLTWIYASHIQSSSKRSTRLRKWTQ